LAGPNGAGKTTFFELFIAPSGLPFVNADFIAKELAEKGKPIADYETACVFRCKLTTDSAAN